MALVEVLQSAGACDEIISFNVALEQTALLAPSVGKGNL